MDIEVQLPAPHSDIQRQIMDFFINPNPNAHRKLWVACGTKFGKTFSASAALTLGVLKSEGYVSRWVAPIYKQTRIGYKYMRTMMPPEPYTKFNKADMIMTVPEINSELEFWHGVNPEDLEGAAIKNQVNDECAKLKQQVYDSSLTTMTFTRGRMLNVSTPRGRNFFWKGCMRAEEEMVRAKHEKRLPKEIFLRAPTAANPLVPRESIEEARIYLPERLFRQYYLADFLEDGATFPVPAIDKELWKRPFSGTGGDTQFWIHPDAANMTVVAGADWAKRNDHTVLTVWDHSKLPFRCVGFYRTFGKKYTDQVVDVAKILNKFKSVDSLYHDRTGVGDAVEDLLDAVPDLVYNGVVFTNKGKATMVNNLITGIEQDEIIFPWWDEALKEMDTYEVTTNDLGNMRYAAAEGTHDDIVSSILLGYAACQEYSSTSMDIKFLEELPINVMAKSAYEQYLEDVLDIDLDEGF